MTNKWDRYFLEIAKVSASMSKDPSTCVGAVLVRDRRIIATCYNGFPKGIIDDSARLNDRRVKYQLVCHAEANAVAQCSLYGISSKDCTLYTTLYPCHECTKLIIQAGIIRVAYPKPSDDQILRWGDSFEISKQMAKEANVEFCEIQGE